MRVLIYANKSKTESENFIKDFSAILADEKIDYSIILRDDLSGKTDADAVFVYGGDGTILALTEFCALNDIPIIGFNAGKMGFLSEFEVSEAKIAIQLLKSGKLKKDERSLIEVSCRNQFRLALNDAVIQRTYNEESDGLVISVSVFLDNIFVDEITGDGVIVSTPTGSTAYSLSAGGAILSPGINAFIITPLSAHSLHHRPIVFSAESVCQIDLKSPNAAVFIDGKKAIVLSESDKVNIKKSNKTITFLRKEQSNFYRRLEDKLSK